MKACEIYIDKIMESVDGVLSPEEEGVLQAHLAQCDGCRALYETYRNIDMGILSMEEEAPEGLTRAVMSSIRQEKEKIRPVYYLKRAKFTLIAVAACLVILVAGRFTGFGSDSAESASMDMATMEMAEAEVVEDAAAEAPAEAPMAEADGAAFMPYFDGGAEEAAEEETVEEEMLEDAAPEVFQAEEPAAMETTDEDMAVGQTEGNAEAFKAVLDALNQDGYKGDLVELFDYSEAMIFEKFPEAVKLELSSGDVVYQVSAETFDALAQGLRFGTVVSTETLGDNVFLWIGA